MVIGTRKQTADRSAGFQPHVPGVGAIVPPVDVQGLIEEAEDALLEKDYERARELAERVIEARHSYGFELLARVHEGQEDLPRAIAVLEDGVAKAPKAWSLWMLLGELRSDHGDYDEALAAYDTALGVEGVDADEVHVNAAIVHERAGRPEDALMRLHEMRGTNAEASLVAARVRAEILNEMERPDAATAAAQAGLALVDDDTEDTDVAPLYAALATAALMKNDRDAALQHAWAAIEHDAAQDSALRVIREIEAQFSEDAKQFRIVVHGQWPAESFLEGDPPDGFWRKYDVVADDEEEAMRFIARVEPELVRHSLRANEVEIVEENVDQAKGVSWCSPYAFYRETDE